MRLWTRFSVHVLVAALLALAACGGSRHEGGEKYYLVSVNIKLPYWQLAGAGLVQAARQLGVQAEMVGPDKYDPQAQVQDFDRIAARKPAGIMVSAADPKLMQAPIDRAIAQGIPVITIDADSPESKRLLFVGTNNYETGRMGGRVASKLLGGKGGVVVYTMPGQRNLDERLTGYEEIFGASIKILKVIDVKGDPALAFDSTKELLAKDDLKPDGFICLEATSCEEVADVLDRNKVTGKVVVAMDTDALTLEWIKKGMIAATIAQKPFTMAYYGVKILDDLYHNKPQKLDANWARDTRSIVPLFVDTGTALIEKGNVDAFMQEPQQ